MKFEPQLKIFTYVADIFAMENLNLIIAWTAVIVCGAMFITSAAMLIHKFFTLFSKPEKASSAEPELSNSALSDFASDSLFPPKESNDFSQDRPTELSQNELSEPSGNEPTDFDQDGTIGFMPEKSF